MVPRYSRPDMTAIWSPEARFRIWFEIEAHATEALAELGALVGSGKLKPRESIAQGIEAAPEAFLGLLKGRNFGKQLVKLI